MEKKMPLSLNDYQNLSKRTLPKGKHSETLTNMALGLVCEAGEVGDHIKKHVFHGHDLDDDKVKKELGDSFFYLAGVATLLGYTLEEIGTMNIEKLMKRFPNGFNEEDSKKRVDTNDDIDALRYSLEKNDYETANFIDEELEEQKLNKILRDYAYKHIPLEENEYFMAHQVLFGDAAPQQVVYQIGNGVVVRYETVEYEDIMNAGYNPHVGIFDEMHEYGKEEAKEFFGLNMKEDVMKQTWKYKMEEAANNLTEVIKELNDYLQSQKEELTRQAIGEGFLTVVCYKCNGVGHVDAKGFMNKLKGRKEVCSKCFGTGYFYER